MEEARSEALKLKWKKLRYDFPAESLSKNWDVIK
jgi:hypothetical protein